MSSREVVRRQTPHEQRDQEAARRGAGDNYGWDAIVAKVMDPSRKRRAATREMDQRA